MRSLPETAPRARGSLRRQLVLSNIVALALLLVGLGLASRYAVYTFMIRSVDNELDRGVDMFQRLGPRGPRPFGGPDGGPDGGPGFGPTFRPLPPEDGPEMIPRGPGGPDMPGRGVDGRGRGPNGRGRGPDGSGRGPDGSGRGPDGPPRGFGPPNNASPYRPHLYTPEGVSLAANDTRPVWDAEALGRSLGGGVVHRTVTVDGEPVRIVSTPAFNPDGRRGAVQFGYPLKEVFRAIRGVDTSLMLLIPVGLLAAGWMGSALTNRILRRVQQMSQTAANIGADNFAERLPVIGNDEFAELAETFNALLGRLDGAYQEQKRLLDLQRRFTADASHELKTPLTVIQGNSSLGAARAGIDDRSRDIFLEINRAADTMARLVQDLLLLARSDEGRLGRDRVEILVIELLQEAKSQAQRKGGAPVRICVEPEELAVTGSQAELSRLFRNLLDNAVRHTTEQGVVEVTAVRSGEAAEVSVRDTGTGIPPEHLPHLGDRFYRVDTARAREDGGTGLGLAISKSIVEAHGGTMQIESTVGKGTTVTVKLPASS